MSKIVNCIFHILFSISNSFLSWNNSTSSKFPKGSKTKIKTVTKTKTLSKKVTGLKAKKKYYVRVRTYKLVNGTRYYSAWTKARPVRTK